MSKEKTDLLPPTYLGRMADALRVLGHAYRLRIVEHLDHGGAAPGHVLLAALGGAQGALSQHLNKMRAAGLIAAERRGREVWYALANPDALTILNCMRKRHQREKRQ
ncbi:MAG: metalloregulator ArsR/SmtB family transcription factor [Kiritimatiellae bacterium]|nr:metalloregulator ArsR/SmtB family transcription factor [Kiritimatiellia bacterium]